MVEESKSVIEAGRVPLLRIIKGSEEGRVFVLREGTNRVGRRTANEVALLQSEVSRYHAVFFWAADLITIEDLHSRNGIWLNDKRLTAGQAVPLIDGDRIRIGESTFQLEKAAVPPSGPEFSGEEYVLPEASLESEVGLANFSRAAPLDRLNLLVQTLRVARPAFWLALSSFLLFIFVATSSGLYLLRSNAPAPPQPTSVLANANPTTVLSMTAIAGASVTPVRNVGITLTTVTPLATPVPTALPVSPPQIIVSNLSYPDIIPTALYTALYQHDPVFTLQLTNKEKIPVRVRISSQILEMTNQAVDTLELPPDTALQVAQRPVLIPAKRYNIVEKVSGTFTYKISYYQNTDGAERTIAEAQRPITLDSRRDMPWLLPGRPGVAPRKLNADIAVWVTPRSPNVEQLLSTATHYYPIVGYQQGTDGVYQQIRAIYRALDGDYAIKYADTPRSSANTVNYQGVQSIRLPDEVLSGHIGNCIEETVTMASALEAANLNVGIVLDFPDNHAYLTVQIDQTKDQWEYIDMTFLGTGRSLDESMRTARSLYQQDKDLPQFDVVYLDKARSSGIDPFEY